VIKWHISRDMLQFFWIRFLLAWHGTKVAAAHVNGKDNAAANTAIKEPK
jgi:hypothetical protein